MPAGLAGRKANSVLNIMDFVLKMMLFALKMMAFVSKGWFFVLKMMNCVLKMMNLFKNERRSRRVAGSRRGIDLIDLIDLPVRLGIDHEKQCTSIMMNLVFNMMNFVFKMMNST